MKVKVQMKPATSSQTVRSPNFRQVYANRHLIRFSSIDMQVKFQQLGEMPDGADAWIEEFSVIMAMPNAKALALTMLEVIASYEAQYGEVSVPGELMPHSIRDCASVTSIGSGARN